MNDSKMKNLYEWLKSGKTINSMLAFEVLKIVSLQTYLTKLRRNYNLIIENEWAGKGKSKYKRYRVVR